MSESGMYHPPIDAEPDLDNPYSKTLAEESFATLEAYNLGMYDHGEYIGDVTPMLKVKRDNGTMVCMRLRGIMPSDKHVAKQMIFGDQIIEVEKQAALIPTVITLEYAETGYIDDPEEVDADELNWVPSVFIGIELHKNESPTITVLDAQTGRELTDEEVLKATGRARAIRSHLTAEFFADQLQSEVTAVYFDDDLEEAGAYDAVPDDRDIFGFKFFNNGSIGEFIINSLCLVCGKPFSICQHDCNSGSVN